MQIPVYRSFTPQNLVFMTINHWVKPTSQDTSTLSFWEQNAWDTADPDTPALRRKQLLSEADLTSKEERELRSLERRKNQRMLASPCYTHGELINNWLLLHQIPVPANQTPEDLFVRNGTCNGDPNCTNPHHWDSVVDRTLKQHYETLVGNNIVCHSEIDNRFGRRSESIQLTEWHTFRSPRVTQLSTKAQLASVLQARKYGARLRKYEELLPVPIRPAELSIIAAFRRLGKNPIQTLDMLGFQNVDSWETARSLPSKYTEECLTIRDAVLAESGTSTNTYEVNTTMLNKHGINYLRPVGVGAFKADIEWMLKRMPPYIPGRIVNIPELTAKLRPWYWQPAARRQGTRPQAVRSYNT